MSDYLSEDLTAEILTRLPPKSLIRFRLLSKSLCSHIGSRDFIRKHTLRHSPAQKVLFRHQTHKNNYVLEDLFTLNSQDQLPKHGYNGIAAVEFPRGSFEIVGSCNGILCLLSKKKGFGLWNPSIRGTLTIPEDPYWGHRFAMNGFGFDPTTDDYKIVRIYYLTCNSVKKSYVYSMRAGTWFEIASPSSPFYLPESAIGCFVNGALHWIVRHTPNAYENVGHRYILTFDLSSHIFGTIALPETSWLARRLTIINGSLAVCFDEGGIRWSIMVMRRECNHTPSDWSVVYRFDEDETISAKVLQLPATGDLLIQSWDDRGIRVLPKTREQSKLVEFNDSSFNIDEMESLLKALNC